MNQKIILFLMPSLMFFKIKAIGVLYLPELISLFLFIQFLPKIILLFRHQLKTFVLLLLLYLFAQIFSDIYRATPSEDYLRGWSNITFFLIHTSTLFVLLSNDKNNFFIFGLGYVLGIILTTFYSPNIYFQGGSFWKFGYGTPITFLIALLTTSKFIQNNFIKILIFLSLAITNFYFGFRSLAGVCLFVSSILFIVNFNSIHNFLNNKKSIQYKIVSSILLIFILTYLVNSSYAYLAINEYLGVNEVARYKSQIGSLGILVGGRQEILTSIYAILNSPFIGYGSWAMNPFSDDLLQGLLLDFGYYNIQAFTYFDDRLPTHSHFFGAWVTAGIFGVFIWIWFLYNIAKALVFNSIKKDNWNGFFYFICILMTWKIFFSTFAGEARFYDAYYLCLILFIVNKFSVNEK